MTETLVGEGTSNMAPDTYLESVVEELNLDIDSKNAITQLISLYRVELKSRSEIVQKYRELGQGLTFKDVEKLRKDINKVKWDMFKIKEAIRTKTESMENEKAVSNAELHEKQDNLRTLKKQCEQALKDRKKELANQLKMKRHEMTINDELREDEGFTKTNWPKEVTKRTMSVEKANANELEELRKEQEENISRFEMEIQEFKETMDMKYGEIEENIQKLRNLVEKKKIDLHNWEMARENRLTFAEVLNGNIPEPAQTDKETATVAE